MMLSFSTMQRDALVEILNIGVGDAAASLSQMVNDEILLSVPTIEFLDHTVASQRLADRMGRRICSITQSFQGSFGMQAVLMFPEEKSLELVRAMVGSGLPLETLGDMEREALAEIGNIILNAVIGHMANLFGIHFDGSLPEVRIGTTDEIVETDDALAPSVVLMAHIHFRVQKLETDGHLAFFLDVPSIEALRNGLDRILRPLA